MNSDKKRYSDILLVIAGVLGGYGVSKISDSLNIHPFGIQGLGAIIIAVVLIVVVLIFRDRLS